jgi:chromosomal replication initiator protein
MKTLEKTASWKACLQALQEGLAQNDSLDPALLSLRAEELDGALSLLAEDHEQWMHVKNNYFLQIKKSVAKTRPDLEVRLLCDVQNVPATEQNTQKRTEIGRGYNKQLQKKLTFSEFVVGKYNELAHSAALHIVENLGEAYNPLLIYGDVGRGKTHLIQAIGNHIIQKNPKAKVLYVHSETFISQMIMALQQNKMAQFKAFYRQADAFLVDDIQFLANKCRTQEEFVHTFNALFDNEQQIVLTSDRYPKELEGLEERLKSRFSWGLTVGLQKPDLETRVAILKQKAISFNVDIVDEVAFFIAQHVDSNVRELEGAFKKVVAHARFSGKKIDRSFVQEVLVEEVMFKARKTSVDNIKQVVAKYYNLKVSELSSKRRNKSLVEARQLAMFLAKELTPHSLPQIGEAFGGRDHTTVIHSCRKISKQLQEGVSVQEDYDNIMRLLSA